MKVKDKAYFEERLPEMGAHPCDEELLAMTEEQKNLIILHELLSISTIAFDSAEYFPRQTSPPSPKELFDLFDKFGSAVSTTAQFFCDTIVGLTNEEMCTLCLLVRDKANLLGDILLAEEIPDEEKH